MMVVVAELWLVLGYRSDEMWLTLLLAGDHDTSNPEQMSFSVAVHQCLARKYDNRQPCEA